VQIKHAFDVNILYTVFMTTYLWYSQLIKPSWAPPSWLFGPVWTVLYLIISVTFGWVFYKTAAKKLKKRVAVPFALNLLFNVLFTPIQFGLRSNFLAALDILLVLTTLIWALREIKPKNKWIVYANIPYLCWVGFATVLQLTITYLNL
jgi:tryptophan-rich sensory protein